MTKEEMKIYADKYRNTQSKLSIVMAIFILIISAVLITFGIILIIYAKGSLAIYFISAIMLILAIADIFVAIRFIKYSKVKFMNMNDQEAAKRYCKIHGFDAKIEK